MTRCHLLEEAQSATVMFVGANERELQQHLPAIERIAGHLQRHGVNAVPEETMRGGLAISDILLSRATDLAADLIVTGAYHHSHLREALIGGASRELLQHMTVPVLMSHSSLDATRPLFSRSVGDTLSQRGDRPPVSSMVEAKVAGSRRKRSYQPGRDNPGTGQDDPSPSAMRRFRAVGSSEEAERQNH